MKLLLAQSDPNDQLQRLLVEYGEVVIARTVNEAVAEFDKGDFDVVVLDVDFGIVFTDAIMLIPWCQPELGVEAMAGGAFDYVVLDNPGVPVEQALRASIDAKIARR